MGQFSVEKPVLPGSVLSGNQQLRLSVTWTHWAGSRITCRQLLKWRAQSNLRR
jgi:hypothetical protein